MVVQKTICCAIRRAASHCRSRIHSEAAAAARWRHTTPLPALLLLFERAGNLSLFLIYASHLHILLITLSIRASKPGCSLSTSVHSALETFVTMRYIHHYHYHYPPEHKVKRCCLYCACCRRNYGSSRWLGNLQPCDVIYLCTKRS